MGQVRLLPVNRNDLDYLVEKVLRRAQFRAGAWHDLAVYGLVRGETPGGP